MKPHRPELADVFRTHEKEFLARWRSVLSRPQLRALRAIMVLERIGSPEARGVLETMSRGAPGTRVTDEAAAALKRLDRLAVQGR